MTRNNTYQAAEILQNAMNELKKLNFDSSAFWADDALTAKDALQAAIDCIDDDLHSNESLIHSENQ